MFPVGTGVESVLATETASKQTKREMGKIKKDYVVGTRYLICVTDVKD